MHTRSAPWVVLFGILLGGCVSSVSQTDGVTIEDRSRATVTLADGQKRAILKKVAPEYPPSARRQRLSGRVLVRFWIAPDGRVTRAEAVRSPHPELSRLAEAAMQQWVFAPAADGKELVMQNELIFEVTGR